jgi:hypothetical protein
MIAYLDRLGRGGEVDNSQCHSICFVQSRPMLDLSEVGLRQQPQYNVQLEHRDWRCFFRPCMLATTDLRKGMFLYLTDFHFQTQFSVLVGG